jgi:hypothetical protein
MTREERLLELIASLRAADVCSTHDEARALIEITMNSIEDRTGIPYNSHLWRTDGRMYPNLGPAFPNIPHHPTVTGFRQRSHVVLIAANGAFEIRETTRPKRVLVSKPGGDGCNPCSDVE